MKQLYPNRFANSHAAHQHKLLKSLLLSFLLVLGSLLAFAKGAPGLNFRNPVLESGVAGKDGAVYRFSKVNNKVDALVRIVGRSDALVYLANIDLTTTGFDQAFQPVVGYNNGTAPGAADWWMDFDISFVDKGTTNLVAVDAFDVSAIDIDGNGDKIHEYVGLYGLSSYLLEANSQLLVSNMNKVINGVNTILGKRFDGPTKNFTGIDTGATAVMVTANYLKTNEFTVRMGGVSTGANGAAERMNSLYFKDFTYNQPQMVLLPVRLKSFIATLTAHQAQLSWTANAEEKLSHYIVERSTDGKEYKEVTLIFASGSSASSINYSYTDKAVGTLSPLVYYRLKMADIDGNYQYSPIRILKLNGDNPAKLAISTFPNPVGSELRISIPFSWQNRTVIYDLFNSNGHIIKHFVNDRAGQTQTLQMSEMSAGVYVVKLTAGNESAIQQVVKL